MSLNLIRRWWHRLPAARLRLLRVLLYLYHELLQLRQLHQPHLPHLPHQPHLLHLFQNGCQQKQSPPHGVLHQW